MGPKRVDEVEVLMPTALAILARYRDDAKRRFLSFAGQAPVVPANVAVPTDALAALKMGIQIGRKEGYGEGLVDGTQLGLDVGVEAAEEMLRQPVILA